MANHIVYKYKIKGTDLYINRNVLNRGTNNETYFIKDTGSVWMTTQAKRFRQPWCRIISTEQVLEYDLAPYVTNYSENSRAVGIDFIEMEAFNLIKI